MTKLFCVMFATAFLVAACGGDREGEAEAPVTTTGTTPSTETDPAESDVVVTFDGTSCTSTMPERTAAGRISIELANQSTVWVEFVMGTYGYNRDRDDLLALAASDDVSPPFWATDSVEMLAPSDGKDQGVYDFEANQYFAVCIVRDSPAKLIVLDDVTVEP